MMGAGIAMAALIDDEGAAQMGDVDFVGAQQIDKVDLALLRAIDNAGDIAAALRRAGSPDPAPPRGWPRCAGC